MKEVNPFAALSHSTPPPLPDQPPPLPPTEQGFLYNVTLSDGRTLKSLTANQIISKAQAGEITSQAKVYKMAGKREGGKKWRPVQEFPEFAPFVSNVVQQKDPTKEPSSISQYNYKGNTRGKLYDVYLPLSWGRKKEVLTKVTADEIISRLKSEELPQNILVAKHSWGRPYPLEEWPEFQRYASQLALMTKAARDAQPLIQPFIGSFRSR
jgi:hypothetical protein